MIEPAPAATVHLQPGAPESLFDVRAVRLAGAVPYNRQLEAAFVRVEDDPATRRSHFFHGRYENLYPAREHIPEIEPLMTVVLASAGKILDTAAPLRIGFWFNRMAPGDVTTLHSHEEQDELLSAVYYVTAPPLSGELKFRDAGAVLAVEPDPGLLLLFPPWLPHEVARHRGEGVRLSVAFNIGPADTDDGP